MEGGDEAEDEKTIYKETVKGRENEKLVDKYYHFQGLYVPAVPPPNNRYVNDIISLPVPGPQLLIKRIPLQYLDLIPSEVLW